MLTNSKKNLANQILEKPLTKQKSEVSHSAFAFLFSEIVQYTYNRISSIEDQARIRNKVIFHQMVVKISRRRGSE